MRSGTRGPIAILRRRPIGIVERAGDRRRRQAAHRGLALVRRPPAPSRCRPRSGASMSASGTSRLSLIVSAWLWQRIAPTRTQSQSTGTAGAEAGAAAEDLVGLGAALPFFQAVPSPRSACRSTGSGCRPAARRSWRSRRHDSARCVLGRRGGRSRGSRDAGSSSSARTAALRAILRQQLAHVLRAAARCGLVVICSSTRPGRP